MKHPITENLIRRAELAACALSEEGDLAAHLVAADLPPLETGGLVADESLDRIAQGLGVSGSYLLAGSDDVDAKLSLIAALRQADPNSVRLRRR